MRTIIIVGFLVLVGSAQAEPVRLYAPDGSIEHVPEESVPAALKQGYKRIPTVMMRTPEGQVVEVYEDAVAYVKETRGYWQMTDEEIREHEQKRFERNVAEGERKWHAENDWWRQPETWVLAGVGTVVWLVVLVSWLRRRRAVRARPQERVLDEIDNE